MRKQTNIKWRNFISVLECIKTLKNVFRKKNHSEVDDQNGVNWETVPIWEFEKIWIKIKNIRIYGSEKKE